MVQLFRKVPELTFLICITVIAYAVIEIAAKSGTEPVLGSFSSIDLIIISFVFSTAIAIVAVIAGVGGGVIFTPIMLAFTSIDTLIIRSTGLVVAMFSGLVATGPFMRKGLADIKLVFFGAVPIIVGGLAGAFAAIFLATHLGETGDAWVRLTLGITLVLIALLFIFGGSNTEYPRPRKVDPLGQRLRLRNTYWEESLQERIRYRAINVAFGGFLFFFVGFTGGFFGLGGGWAVVPVLNLVMAIPLKVSAASSGVLLAMGNAAAIWPYLTVGALIGIVAAPWMLGQVIGGIIGAHILATIKAAFVRNLLIALLILTSLKLIARGLERLLKIEIPIL
ncbi:MAG: sulfite exporter TauE/SafE family protein [Rhodospirillales bacterium]